MTHIFLVQGWVFHLQRFIIQPFLHDAPPCDDPVSNGAAFICPKHLLELIFGLLLLLPDTFQLLTGFIVLAEKLGSGIR